MTWALSTDEVREAYILAADTTNADRDNGEDFDHWLNRVRAEARAEAFREAREAINHTRNVPSLITLADKFGGYHQGERAGLEMAEGVIARIEQNSEGGQDA